MAGGDDTTGGRAARIGAWLLHEFSLVLPPTVYFLVCFNLLVLTVTLATGQGVSAAQHGAASFVALVVGKAVLIADKLPFVNRYPEHPLIWNASWKALIYFAVAFAIRVLEHVLEAARNPHGFGVGWEEATSDFRLGLFLAVQLWLALLLLLYAGFRELVRALGPRRVRAMFFRDPDASGGPAGP
ncbi:MAG: hypothetical protein VYD87_07830 [Pseudomonadota bacterium]|nr:hypothetical protein [Pseudomonadota bacterium]